jgi:hypothetical protein
MTAFPVTSGLDVVGRPNGRLEILALCARVFEEDFLDAYVNLDFTRQGVKLYLYHPETEDRDSRTIILYESDRYDRSLAMRLQAQKLVDIYLIQDLSFTMIQNFMARCRLFR